MEILLIIFFFGVTVSLVVLKGLFMSQEFASQTKRVRDARLQNDQSAEGKGQARDQRPSDSGGQT